MSDPRVTLLAAGYEGMAERFLDWAHLIEGDPRLDRLEELTSRLPDGARVLELGCGAGASFEPPANRALVEAASPTVLRDEVVTFVEPGHGDSSFQWLLARR